MLVKVFGPIDIKILQEWLEKRDQKIDPLHIPNYGYVIYSIISKEPVAMAFIREQGNLGFIEGLTTNPDSSSEDRNEAIDTVITHLLSYAKRQGIYNVFGYTIDDRIMKRIERHGFVKQPHVMFSINLGG